MIARCEAVSDWRCEARRAIADLKIDPFNRAALYKIPKDLVALGR